MTTHAHHAPAGPHGHDSGHGSGHDGPVDGHASPAPAHAHGHGHGHGDHGQGHGDHADLDWSVLADHLETGAELHLPAHRRIADHLGALFGPDRPVRRVLDIGSGPGVMTCLLAEAFPHAEAVAVDGSAALLDRTLARADRLGLAGRVTARHARLPEDLSGDTGVGTADLVWTSKTVHHLGDQQAALDTLAGALRPGGVLAVAEGGLPMRFLPRDIGVGRPGLQSRLDAAHERSFQDMRESLPGSTPVVEDWAAMLRRAGLGDVRSFTALVDVPAPLDDAGRAFLHLQLSRLRENTGGFLDAGDLRTLDVLVDPASEAGVLLRPDVFLLSAVTVHTGVRPHDGARRAAS
ncbi:methyltransferase [Streptomyces sp. NPDC048606]|uniref:class I SAM-dependent methyltransferase n=1 Tax=Streptomyces sp. NPDC048606 TaxID=3154726 RepID=UPI0034467BCA